MLNNLVKVTARTRAQSRSTWDTYYAWRPGRGREGAGSLKRGAHATTPDVRGVLSSPTYWCRWSWGHSHHCCRRCIRQCRCRPEGQTLGRARPVRVPSDAGEGGLTCRHRHEAQTPQQRKASGQVSSLIPFITRAPRPTQKPLAPARPSSLVYTVYRT